jgi:hypothetical protein
MRMILWRVGVRSTAILSLFIATSVNLSAAMPSFGCIEEMPVPKYPALARAARMQGIVEVLVEFQESLRRPSVSLNSGPKLLQKAVAAAFDHARFPNECTEKRFVVRFSFEIDLNATPRNFDEGAVIIRWPGTVIIRASRLPMSGSSSTNRGQ